MFSMNTKFAGFIGVALFVSGLAWSAETPDFSVDFERTTKATPGAVEAEVTGVPDWIEGVEGSAALFDGKTSLSYPAVLPSLGPECTVSVWFRADDYESGSVVRLGSNMNRIILSAYGAGSIQASFQINDQYCDITCTEGAPYFETGTWNQAVLTCDGISVRLYLNGKLLGERLTEGGNLTVGPDVSIGSENDIHMFFKGAVDRLQVFNTALSADTIASEFTQLQPL